MAFQWNSKGSLRGPKGDAGERGPAGAQGASLRTANITISADSDVALDAITPSSNITIGDILMDVTGGLYAVSSISDGASVHVGSALAVNLRGPQGPQGEAGKDGTGVNILGSYDDLGALQEAHPTGDPGDAYLIDGDLYVWSSNESAWKNVGSIEGPQGERGPQGPKGETGAAGAQGPQGPAGPGITVGTGTPQAGGVEGATYLDISTGVVYQYENV